MPFLMFGFKTYYVECPNGERFEIENYSKQINLSEYEKYYCDLESLSLKSNSSEFGITSLPPLPSTNFTASYPSIVH